MEQSNESPAYWSYAKKETNKLYTIIHLEQGKHEFTTTTSLQKTFCFNTLKKI